MKYRRPKKTIAAAVRIEIPLYQHALRKIETSDTNFSQYVRSLIRRDLASAGVLVVSK